jgi:hypothetical protein
MMPETESGVTSTPGLGPPNGWGISRESRRPPQAGVWRAGCRRQPIVEPDSLLRQRRGADRRLPAGVTEGIPQLHLRVRRNAIQLES